MHRNFLMLALIAPAGQDAWANDSQAEGRVEVHVTGIGADHDAAQADARRAAVLQALVSLTTPDGEQLGIESPEILQTADRVCSTKCIMRYQEVNVRHADGLVLIDAVVLVRLREPRKAKGGAEETLAEAARSIDGPSLAASLSATVASRADARASLLEAIAAFESVSVGQLIGKPEIVESDNQARLLYRARISIDERKYETAVDNLRSTLAWASADSGKMAGRMSDVSGCQATTIAALNVKEPGNWACFTIYKTANLLSNPSIGDVGPDVGMVSQYVVHRALLRGGRLPYGYHALTLTLADGEGQAIVTDRAGPCSFIRWPLDTTVSCDHDRGEAFSTTGVSSGRFRGSLQLAFQGAIRKPPSPEYVQGIDFTFQLNIDAKDLARVRSARLDLEFVPFSPSLPL